MSHSKNKNNTYLSHSVAELQLKFDGDEVRMRMRVTTSQ